MEGFINFWAEQGPGGFVRIFWFYFFLEFPRYVLLDYVFLISYRLKQRFNFNHYVEARHALWTEFPLVTILIPGKNEGKNYYRLIRSLDEQSYQNFQLIIVDDGSDDDSVIIAQKMKDEGKIDLFLRNDQRGGKAAAANLALRYARGKYVVHLDADSSFHRDAIEQILIPFYQEESVGAVGGTLEVRNGDQSLVTRFQTIEYLLNFTVGRLVSSSLGILRIISGAFGVFRTDLLKVVGGWDVGPGLDGDITLKIRKMGYNVAYTPLAVCLTSVPDTAKKLIRQRLRWSRSLVRFRLRKHRDVLFPSQHFNFRDFLAVSENIFYELVLNILWWFYLIEVILHFTPDLGYIMIAGFFLYTTSKYLEFALVPLLSVNKSDRINLLAYIPGMTFYTGFFIRGIRTIAYISEFFFFHSYKDDWNPQKTSDAVKEVDDDIRAVFRKRSRKR